MATAEERLTALETNEKNIFHRLDEIRKDLEDIHELTASVKIIAAETVSISRKVDKVDSRLQAVENKPAEDLRYYKRTVISCVITALVSGLIASAMTMILR
ncbi:MAG: hypothetical protein K5756_04820 [Clostridiales bacterium]|nr:hypothetical protein [Clostridiales bacterium]